MNPTQLRELVVRPVLKYLEPEIPYSEEAEDLLMMTAAHESNCGLYLKQIEGVALGIYQMEPATELDIVVNFLEHRDELNQKIVDLIADLTMGMSPLGSELIWNLAYATAMARVHYWRVPAALPSKDDQDYRRHLAVYAKEYYNTQLGKATISDYYNAYTRSLV